jgi:hypothetical protein
MSWNKFHKNLHAFHYFLSIYVRFGQFTFGPLRFSYVLVQMACKFQIPKSLTDSECFVSHVKSDRLNIPLTCHYVQALPLVVLEVIRSVRPNYTFVLGPFSLKVGLFTLIIKHNTYFNLNRMYWSKWLVSSKSQSHWLIQNVLYQLKEWSLENTRWVMELYSPWT